MLYRFDYKCEFDTCDYSEIIECANEVEALEVAHQLPAIILEHKRNIHTRSELYGPKNDQHTKIIVKVDNELFGILTYSTVNPLPPRTANDIYKQWVKSVKQ